MALDLADVFRAHGGGLDPVNADQQRVARAIVRCRTAALGGHVDRCDRCGHERISYNSCRDRHCPKCQALAQAEWLEARAKEILPVPYFHTVFTIPEELDRLFLASRAVAYGLLFAAVAETLREVALRPKNLGAKIGFTAILHTWTQTLLYHPHVHCLVPAGGLSPDGQRWVACKPGFFLPVRVLSAVFRGKLLEKLGRALAAGDIRGSRPDAAGALRQAAKKDWVVYAKRPNACPKQVLRYLARYTHRIAISNDRLLSMDGDRVTFLWKDRRQADRKRTMTLDAKELLRRFLLHVLPTGFVRIRHYGLLANGRKQRLLERCRALLAAADDADPDPVNEPAETWHDLLLRLTGEDAARCPACREGRLVFAERLLPAWRPP